MQKQKITNFISKYNLGGLCNSVKIVNEGGKLSTRFTTEEKDVLGYIEFNEIHLADHSSVFGIFNTSILQKVLNIMNAEVNVNFNSQHGKLMALNISDNVFESIIQLADLAIIEDAPTIKELPDPDITINITQQLIEQFIKAKSALSDSSKMAFINEGDEVRLIINYSEHASDIIKLNLEVKKIQNNIDIMQFNSDKFKEILVANKDCISGTIELSSAGLMTISFTGNDYRATYYQIMLQ